MGIKSGDRAGYYKPTLKEKSYRKTGNAPRTLCRGTVVLEPPIFKKIIYKLCYLYFNKTIYYGF